MCNSSSMGPFHALKKIMGITQLSDVVVSQRELMKRDGVLCPGTEIDLTWPLSRLDFVGFSYIRWAIEKSSADLPVDMVINTILNDVASKSNLATATDSYPDIPPLAYLLSPKPGRHPLHWMTNDPSSPWLDSEACTSLLRQRITRRAEKLIGREGILSIISFQAYARGSIARRSFDLKSTSLSAPEKYTLRMSSFYWYFHVPYFINSNVIWQFTKLDWTRMPRPLLGRGSGNEVNATGGSGNGVLARRAS
ncbi:hypothetical protein BD779DRAFT_1792245 [Infundibulicybe gibba]|nr:hypothetical protein BD779DRAFT_1792245 [Infundibulicybe gibba]